MRCLAFSFLLILASCAGYQVENRDNPLDRYAIESLAIPQFVNYSNIAGVAEMLTKEFTFLFSQYNGLKLYSGENPKAQAILVGVVDGPRKIKDTVGIEQTVLTTGALKESIGARQEFAVPISARYELTVHITIIKDPNYNELQMIKTGGFQNNNIPRVVIDKRLPLTGVYKFDDRRDHFSRFPWHCQLY